MSEFKLTPLLACNLLTRLTVIFVVLPFPPPFFFFLCLLHTFAPLTFQTCFRFGFSSKRLTAFSSAPLIQETPIFLPPHFMFFCNRSVPFSMFFFFFFYPLQTFFLLSPFFLGIIGSPSPLFLPPSFQAFVCLLFFFFFTSHVVYFSPPQLFSVRSLAAFCSSPHESLRFLTFFVESLLPIVFLLSHPLFRTFCFFTRFFYFLAALRAAPFRIQELTHPP